MENISRTCHKCNIEKDISFFYKEKSRKHGRSYVCKDCVKDYYQANKDRINEKRKVYVKNNPELIKKISQKSKNKNINRVRENERKRDSNNINKLRDPYIKRLLVNTSRDMGFFVSGYDITKDIIQLKRIQLKLHREIYK